MHRLGVLQHHDRVCSIRQHTASVDQCTLTGTDFKHGRVSHGNFTDESQVRGQRVCCAECIRCADGVTIHSGALEIRQGMRRDDVFREDAIQN